MAQLYLHLLVWVWFGGGDILKVDSNLGKPKKLLFKGKIDQRVDPKNNKTTKKESHQEYNC